MLNFALIAHSGSSILLLKLISIFIALQLSAEDPLPSWNEGKKKSAILQFIKETTQKGGKNYVPPDERIAAFDQDGTLWVEQPLYTQMMFAIDRIKKIGHGTS